MRTFAALVGMACTALLATGRQPQEVVCPAIAQAPVVALTVTREYAGSVKTLRLKACQDGRCKRLIFPLPVRTLTFTPRVAYPYGAQCGRFISAGVLLDADGLRKAAWTARRTANAVNAENISRRIRTVSAI
jgi:hypothetical protein